MISRKKKILKSTLVLLLLFFLIIQGVKGSSIIKEKKLLYLEISQQQNLINDLKNKYSKDENSSQLLDLKANTSEILAELEFYNLKLIDFSSTETEVNLNLRGDFNSILKFIYYLDNEAEGLKINQFKIKKDQDNLFFFVKLKNELM